MREIKFRAWSIERGMIQNPPVMTSLPDGFLVCQAYVDGGKLIYLPLMQYTGLKDKNGVEIYEGDLLNVCFTSSDGEHIHDCVYSALIGQLGDIQFQFESLLWIDNGYNQYPSSTTLCARYKTLDYEYEDKALKLKVPDSWGENNLLMSRWKSNDKSFFFEVIGNIYQNTELLAQ